MGNCALAAMHFVMGHAKGFRDCRPARVGNRQSLSKSRDRFHIREWNAGRNAGRAASRLRSPRQFQACREASRRASPVRNSCRTTVVRSSASPGGQPCASASAPCWRCAGRTGRRRWNSWSGWSRRPCPARACHEKCGREREPLDFARGPERAEGHGRGLALTATFAFSATIQVRTHPRPARGRPAVRRIPDPDPGGA